MVKVNQSWSNSTHKQTKTKQQKKQWKNHQTRLNVVKNYETTFKIIQKRLKTTQHDQKVYDHLAEHHLAERHFIWRNVVWPNYAQKKNQIATLLMCRIHKCIPYSFINITWISLWNFIIISKTFVQKAQSS